VWALGDPWQREQIEGAHARAVESTVRYMREQVPVVHGLAAQRRVSWV
jgi:hypothetical protein